MKKRLKNILIKSTAIVKRIVQPDMIAAVVIAVTVIGVTINTTGVIMQNYQLEKEVRVMQQKVAIAEVELQTQKAKNQYLATDYYLDIAARKQLSKGSPGEKLIIVPKSVALSALPAGYSDKVNTATSDTTANLSNFRKWQLFLTGDLQ